MMRCYIFLCVCCGELPCAGVKSNVCARCRLVDRRCPVPQRYRPVFGENARGAVDVFAAVDDRVTWNHGVDAVPQRALRIGDDVAFGASGRTHRAGKSRSRGLSRSADEYAIERLGGERQLGYRRFARRRWRADDQGDMAVAPFAGERLQAMHATRRGIAGEDDVAAVEAIKPRWNPAGGMLRARAADYA